MDKKTLWNLLKGEQCSIQGFNPALDSNYCVRLTELGFLPEAVVTCQTAPKFGAPKLYRVNDTIYSLDDDITKFVDIQLSA